MLQKILDAIIQYFGAFVIAHPRLFCTIIGTLGALALLACVVSINILLEV